jgi:hypothetical protein
MYEETIDALLCFEPLKHVGKCNGRVLYFLYNKYM